MCAWDLVIEFALEPFRSITSVHGVGKVRGGNDQRAIANEVSNSTVDLDLILGEVLDLPAILLLAGVAEEYHALDHVFDLVREVRDRAVHDSCSLTVI